MPTRPLFATRTDCLASLPYGSRKGEWACECGYCRRWFVAVRRDALTCSPSCRKALSLARTRKRYHRESYGDHSDAPSACASASERAMRDLAARRVEPGPSRWAPKD